MASQGERLEAETRLVTAESELQQNRFRLRMILGLGERSMAPEAAPAGTGKERRSVSRPPVPGNLEEWLGPAVVVELNAEEMPLPELLQSIQEQVRGEHGVLSFVLNREALANQLSVPEEILVTLSLKSGTTLRNALLAIADLYPVCFVLRDYGILVTTHYQAQELYAATIPADLPLAPDAAGDLEALKGLGYLDGSDDSGVR
jgi:hypothetical protein